MTGSSRIGAALDQADMVFASSSVVPHNNNYFSGYNPVTLKVLRDKRDFYRTYEVNPGLGQHINYALRVAVKVLMEQVDRSLNAELFMATMVLDEDYVQKLERHDAKRELGLGGKLPMDRLSTDIRKQLCLKADVTDYLFVIEDGDNGNTHVHLVGVLPDSAAFTLKEIGEKCRTLNLVSKTQNAVRIQTEYRPILFRSRIGDENANLLENEIELLGKDSIWEPREWIKSTSGGSQCFSFQTRERIPLDTGIADYLAKDLSKSRFKSSRNNFHISRLLRQVIHNAFEEHVARIKSGKSK